MEAYLVEWLSLLGRWVHMVVGIAWIGASLYFIWLDNHLLTPQQPSDQEKGVGGELWAVHGGGFYHSQKYKIAPETLPGTLHWFKWEAYTTWMSGMFLMALIYWYGAELYLIDTSIAQLSKPVAIVIGMAVIALGWIVYDLLCRSSFSKNETALSAVLFALLAIAAWGLCQIFSGRGAYMHYGAILGTIMVANVFFVIIPGQKDLVQAKEQNRAPDPAHGIRAKQRSVHNTYFTLPVLFIMVSNHYAMTFGHAWNWLVLVGFTLAGALIRVFFVARHSGSASPIPLIVAAALLCAIAFVIAPTSAKHSAHSKTNADDDTTELRQTFAKVRSIVQQRCTSCHATKPTQPGFVSAPKGVVFESDEDIMNQVQVLHQQTVVTRAMPIGNLTQMTDDERMLLDRWVQDGARQK